MGEAGSPAGGNAPELALRIVHERALGPAEQAGRHMAAAFPRSGPAGHQGRAKVRRHQQAPVQVSDHAAPPRQEPRSPRLLDPAPAARPARTGVSPGEGASAQAQGETKQDEAAGPGEHLRSLGRKAGLPDEDGPGRIEHHVGRDATSRPEGGREVEGPGDELRGGLEPERRPDHRACHSTDHATHCNNPALNTAVQKRRNGGNSFRDGWKIQLRQI